MWTTIRINYKTILSTVGILILASVLAVLFEDHYRQLVRYSFKIFHGEKIQFYGKNFHLFASDRFVFAFGLFGALTFLIVKFSLPPERIKKTGLAAIIFFVTTIIITAVDSKLLILECTACEDGIRWLTFNQPHYDAYFIISLSVATAYLLTSYLLEHKRQKLTK